MIRHPAIVRQAWVAALILLSSSNQQIANASQDTTSLSSNRSTHASTPTVRFVQPSDGQAIRDVFHIVLEPTPGSGISQVIVFEDHAVLGVVLEPPFDIAWDTRREAEGPHRLQAKVVDGEFREGFSSTVTVTVDNTPPTVSLVTPADGLRVAGAVSLEARANDNLGVEFVRFLVNGQAIGEVTTAPYRMEWNSTVVPNVKYGIEARAFDRAGNSTTSQTNTIKVANFNHHPILDPVGPQTVEEGTPLTFTLHATDADGARDPLTFQAFNLPPWATLDPKTGIFQGTPGHAEASLTHPEKVYAGVRFEVCDPEPLCDSQETTITVLDRNNPPVLQPLKDQTIGEQSLLRIPLVASDPDGDPLTCTASSIPPWTTFDASNCVLTGRPGPEVATLEEPHVVYSDVHFEVCDPDGLCASQTITITVENVENRAPVLDPIPPQTVDEGKSLKLVVRADDPDRDAVTLTAAPLPEGAVFTDNQDRTGTFLWTPRYDQAGTYQVAVVASDGSLSDGKPVTITVRESSRAVSGVVLNKYGDPVAGVEIELATTSEVTKTATTDDHGYYLIKDVASGEYRLQPHYQEPETFSSTARLASTIKFDPPFVKVTMTDHDRKNVNFLLYK